MTVSLFTLFRSTLYAGSLLAYSLCFSVTHCMRNVRQWFVYYSLQAKSAWQRLLHRRLLYSQLSYHVLGLASGGSLLRTQRRERARARARASECARESLRESARESARSTGVWHAHFSSVPFLVNSLSLPPCLSPSLPLVVSREDGYSTEEVSHCPHKAQARLLGGAHSSNSIRMYFAWAQPFHPPNVAFNRVICFSTHNISPPPNTPSLLSPYARRCWAFFGSGKFG
jgi:hypothetical protein